MSDTGEADPALLAALSSWQASPDEAGCAAVLAAVGSARVLVPVTAELPTPGSRPGPGAGMPVEKGAEKVMDLSLVTLVGNDGRIALPAFTSVAAMTAWRPDTRPVAVDGSVACAAAVAEGHSAVVFDVAGAAFVLEGDALLALAVGPLGTAGPDASRRRPWLRPLVVVQLVSVEAVVWSAAWAIFRGPAAFYPAMFVGGLLGAAVVARAGAGRSAGTQ